jgi:anti-sigma regulatory factor (Ser/Thr protein kinase)
MCTANAEEAAWRRRLRALNTAGVERNALDMNTPQGTAHPSRSSVALASGCVGRARLGLRWMVGGTEPGGSETELLLELSLPAVPASCARARHEVCAVLHGVRVDLAAVELAVSEAVTNAVVHAYRDRTGEIVDERVGVRVTKDRQGICVGVADDGVGMSPRGDSPGLGLGLPMIERLSDELVILQGATGTRLQMHFVFVPDRAGAPQDRL